MQNKFKRFLSLKLILIVLALALIVPTVPSRPAQSVAPVIATLLMVEIAVVGGTIIFVFSQGFFSDAQIDDPGDQAQLDNGKRDLDDIMENDTALQDLLTSSTKYPHMLRHSSKLVALTKASRWDNRIDKLFPEEKRAEMKLQMGAAHVEYVDLDDTILAIVSKNAEVCDDTADNDKNGDADCDDSACSGLAYNCNGTETSCTNQVDDDADGDKDCDDADCATQPECGGGGVCGDGTVDPNEECDPQSNQITCPDGFSCTGLCICLGEQVP